MHGLNDYVAACNWNHYYYNSLSYLYHILHDFTFI